MLATSGKRKPCQSRLAKEGTIALLVQPEPICHRLLGAKFCIVDSDGNGAYQANTGVVFELQAPVGTFPAIRDFFT